MRSRPVRRALLLALLLPAWPAVAAGAGETTEESSATSRGELLFRVHCASCHGESGRGDGPMREALRRPPADLTRLRDARSGEFPFDRVARVVDGRQEVLAHGLREMPVWGITFQESGRDADQEAEVENRILDIVRYLRSIQR